VIEVHLDLGGYPVTLVDTAGLREASGEIEIEGMRRTHARAGMADLVLWLVDASDPQWEPPKDLIDTGGNIITVLNKIDLGRPKGGALSEGLAISAKTSTGLDNLIGVLAARGADAMDAGEPAVVTRARQRLELETCREALKAFLAGEASQLELRAEDLRVAARALGRLSGRVDVEEVLDCIFGDFCIGK